MSRGRLVLRFASSAGVAALLVAVAGPSSAGNGDPVGGHPTWRERALLALTNACRQGPRQYRDRWLPGRRILASRRYPPVHPLYASPALDRAARAHSLDMARTPCFQHDSCDGTSLWTRIRSFYPRGTAMSENIAFGYRSPLETVNGWILDKGAADGSRGDGHRRNLMSAKYTVAGHGSARGGPGGTYDTQDFANGTPAFTSPLVSGSHVFDTDGTVVFLASWHAADGRPPGEAMLEFRGEDDVAMTLAFGTPRSGTWRAVLPAGDGCRAYRFAFEDAGGRTWRYPENGTLFTTGEGGCRREYEAD